MGLVAPAGPSVAMGIEHWGLPNHLACRGRRLQPQLQPLQVRPAKLSPVGWRQQVVVAFLALEPGVPKSLQVRPNHKEVDFLRCPPVRELSVDGTSAGRVLRLAFPYIAALQLTSLLAGKRLDRPIMQD